MYRTDSEFLKEENLWKKPCPEPCALESLRLLTKCIKQREARQKKSTCWRDAYAQEGGKFLVVGRPANRRGVWLVHGGGKYSNGAGGDRQAERKGGWKSGAIRSRMRESIKERPPNQGRMRFASGRKKKGPILEAGRGRRGEKKAAGQSKEKNGGWAKKLSSSKGKRGPSPKKGRKASFRKSKRRFL